MNQTKHHLLAAMLLAALCAPGAVLAETAAIAAVASPPTDASDAVDAAPADRMELKQDAGAGRMTMDPAKCKAMLEKRQQFRDARQSMGPAGGMGMGMGMGMMQRPGMNPDGCPDNMGQRRDRSSHDERDEQRMDALESRMDMMQMMLRMLLGR